ncbi:MAG: transposase, partial [bacterium]|nr:transposase [bacterium]
MFISNEVLPFVKNFIDDLNEALKKINPHAELSKAQKAWLGFCLVAIVVTNSICWKKFERAS